MGLVPKPPFIFMASAPAHHVAAFGQHLDTRIQEAFGQHLQIPAAEFGLSEQDQQALCSTRRSASVQMQSPVWCKVWDLRVLPGSPPRRGVSSSLHSRWFLLLVGQ